MDEATREDKAAPALLLDHVVKSYGALRAVDGVSLTVQAGEFIALLGPNGAGKTTLFQLLSGLFAADSGRIVVMGHDMSRDPVPALAQLGIVFQQPTLDPQSRSDLLALMLAMRAERSVAVLWATHLCDEVPDADRVVVLHRGKVLADTTPANLVAAAGATSIEQAFLSMTGRTANG
jgi:ABC-type multidrug transport system ATPase subunit